MGRYIVRVFADVDQNDSTAAGTFVRPQDLQLSFYTESADEAEKRLCREVQAGKLSKGRVYQICPSIGSFEPIRTCAVGVDGSAQRVFLDPVDGLYSQTRRIRLPRSVVDEDPVEVRQAG
jgi:hypothetical protein